MQEPGEAANKLLKRWTLSHCRQRGILHRNLDLHNWFVEMSDPVTLQNMDQNTRHERNREATSLTIPPEVIALCKDPTELQLQRLPILILKWQTKFICESNIVILYENS